MELEINKNMEEETIKDTELSQKELLQNKIKKKLASFVVNIGEFEITKDKSEEIFELPVIKGYYKSPGPIKNNERFAWIIRHIIQDLWFNSSDMCGPYFEKVQSDKQEAIKSIRKDFNKGLWLSSIKNFRELMKALKIIDNLYLRVLRFRLGDLKNRLNLIKSLIDTQLLRCFSVIKINTNLDSYTLYKDERGVLFWKFKEVLPKAKKGADKKISELKSKEVDEEVIEFLNSIDEISEKINGFKYNDATNHNTLIEIVGDMKQLMSDIAKPFAYYCRMDTGIQREQLMKKIPICTELIWLHTEICVPLIHIISTRYNFDNNIVSFLGSIFSDLNVLREELPKITENNRTIISTTKKKYSGNKMIKSNDTRLINGLMKKDDEWADKWTPVFTWINYAFDIYSVIMGLNEELGDIESEYYGTEGYRDRIEAVIEEFKKRLGQLRETIISEYKTFSKHTQKKLQVVDSKGIAQLKFV